MFSSPISTLETVLAFVGAGATKTLVVGVVIYFTASFFADVLWPDFDGEHIDRAFESFSERQRRFGKRI